MTSKEELRDINPYGHLTVEIIQQRLHDEIRAIRRWLEKENKMPVRAHDLKLIYDRMFELEVRLDILYELASHDLWLECEKHSPHTRLSSVLKPEEESK
tara:strand:+ start:27 stop:323 length:297 start_codon:yes stop_codon:yes gene_type:complete